MKRLGTLLLATATICSLTLSGCGGGSSDSSSGGNEASSAKSKTDTTSISYALPDGLMGAENNNIYVAGSTISTKGYGVGIYEPLAVMNSVNPTQPTTPWLAEEFTWAPDYKSVELKARSGVNWSDGEAFSAEDIEYTLQMFIDHPEFDKVKMPLENVTRDGDTVTATFTESMFTRQEQLLHKVIVPKHIWSEIDDLANWNNPDPIGTGPYVLESFTPQTATLVRNDGYWNGELAADTLYFMAYNDNNAVATGLANGEVDCSQIFIPNVQSVYLDKDPENFNYVVQAQMNIDALFLNVTTKPFDDVNFRRALNMVADRNMHSEIAREGIVPPLESITGIPTPVGESYIAPDFVGKQYDVDVEGARKLLEESGYTWDGDALVDPDGEPVVFSMTATQGWSDYVTGLSLIADQAQKLGADAKVVTMDYDTWEEDVRRGNFQATFYWTKSGLTPFNIYNPIMGAEFLEPIGESASFNFGRYDNPEVQGLLNTYATSSDEAERVAAMNRVEEIFVEDVPAIAIGTRPSIGSYSTRNFVGWPTLEDPYASADLITVTGILVLNALEPANS